MKKGGAWEYTPCGPWRARGRVVLVPSARKSAWPENPLWHHSWLPPVRRARRTDSFLCAVLPPRSEGGSDASGLRKLLWAGCACQDGRGVSHQAGAEGDPDLCHHDRRVVAIVGLAHARGLPPCGD